MHWLFRQFGSLLRNDNREYLMTSKTNVIGYFNPNIYPLQLSLAEFNMVLQLQPKAYVVDRSGRLVNDPVLDRFVGKGKLARASDQKQQVEITFLRPVNDTSPTPAAHQHSVSQAARFDTKDGRVVAVAPVSTASQPLTPPPQSYNPVRGLTIEQAKQLKLIKPTRPVPEDFGADETSGAPKSGQDIPTIKYATDSVRGRKPAPLPAELTTPATPQQAAIITSLEKAAVANPEDPNLLTHIARTTAESVQGVPPVVGLPKPVLDEVQESASAQPVRLTPPPIPVNPTPTAIVTLPPPPEEVAAESSLIVEEELTGQPASQTSTQAEDRADEARRLSPPPKVGTVSCPLCSGKSFANRGMFLRHVRLKHSDKEAELMAPHAAA
jgi:hypothetical protein